jgi:hypothetical protein
VFGSEIFHLRSVLAKIVKLPWAVFQSDEFEVSFYDGPASHVFEKEPLVSFVFGVF